MKIQFHNQTLNTTQELNIRFNYPRGKEGIIQTSTQMKHKKPITECTVTIGEPFSSHEDKTLLGYAKVVKNDSDTTNLVVARTAALAKVLIDNNFTYAETMQVIEKLNMRYSEDYLLNLYLQSTLENINQNTDTFAKELLLNALINALTDFQTVCNLKKSTTDLIAELAEEYAGAMK